MNCSIVIRAYNEAGHLPRLLEGIRQQTVEDVEIILVDSGSTDDTVLIAESYGAQVVRIPSDEFTFGRSLNFGVRAARRELVVVASAHVYPVYPDWLECLLRPFEDDQVALVYGKQRGMETSKFSEHRIFRQWFPDTDVAQQDSPFCNNANAAIRRSFWEGHPYDETLTGLEDLAWAKWAQGAGYVISYAAHAEIIHVHDERPRGIYNRYRREAMAFKRIFPESHFCASDRHQYPERPVSCVATARVLEKFFIRFLVPFQPVLGDVPGLPSVRPRHPTVATDVLLSPLERHNSR